VIEITGEDENMSLQILVPRILTLQSKGTLDDNVNIDNITISINGNDLLVNASLKLQKGRRYGLIGKNGVGKVNDFFFLFYFFFFCFIFFFFLIVSFRPHC
jgi:ABC-type bacteriocin/lantibiotic exporter with double-glycine peptidase domain